MTLRRRFRLAQMVRQARRATPSCGVSRRFQDENFPPKHFAVIFFGIVDDERVLLRAKISVGRYLAVALQIFHRLRAQCDQFLDDRFSQVGAMPKPAAQP